MDKLISHAALIVIILAVIFEILPILVISAEIAIVCVISLRFFRIITSKRRYRQIILQQMNLFLNAFDYRTNLIRIIKLLILNPGILLSKTFLIVLSLFLHVPSPCYTFIQKV